jgi:hypothetical protein
MKKIILNIAVGLLTISSTFAQTETCPTLKLKDGMQLIYFTETAPPPLYKMKGEYFKAKPKEQQKMKEQYLKEPWITDVQTNTIKLVTLSSINAQFISTTVKRAKETNSSIFYSSCNDKDYISRGGFIQLDPSGKIIGDYMNIKINSVPNDSTKMTGYSILYDKSYPFNLEVGMKLPNVISSYNVFTMGTQITFAREKILSTKVENRWVGNSANIVAMNYGKVVKDAIQEQITANIATTSIMEIWIKNREVKDKKEVTVSGKNYTAYLIREETWTGGTMWQVKSDDEWVQKKNQKQAEKGQKAVEDLLKKNENANEEGYIVTVTESWFIPEIGAYSMTSYNSWGDKVGYLELKEIK